MIQAQSITVQRPEEWLKRFRERHGWRIEATDGVEAAIASAPLVPALELLWFLTREMYGATAPRCPHCGEGGRFRGDVPRASVLELMLLRAHLPWLIGDAIAYWQEEHDATAPLDTCAFYRSDAQECGLATARPLVCSLSCIEDAAAVQAVTELRDAVVARAAKDLKDVTLKLLWRVDSLLRGPEAGA